VGPPRGARRLGDRHGADGGHAARTTVADIRPRRSPTGRPSTSGRRGGPPTSTRRRAGRRRGPGSPTSTRRARAALPRLLSHPTIASKRWIYRQYDHMVQHGTVVLPGSDAGVVRLRLGEGEKFIAISNDCNGRYCYLNPRRGAQIAMVECLRNLVCAGATPLAMTDNLNFGNPYKPENFYQLRECVAGLAEACRSSTCRSSAATSRSTTSRPRARSTRRPRSRSSASSRTRRTSPASSRGRRRPARPPGRRALELGGSQFLGLVHGLKTGDAPAVDLAAEKRLQDLPPRPDPGGRVGAAHDLSEGGLLVALCEMLFGPAALGRGGSTCPASGAPARRPPLRGEPGARPRRRWAGRRGGVHRRRGRGGRAGRRDRAVTGGGGLSVATAAGRLLGRRRVANGLGNEY
jgi:hypothetical protein